MARPQHYLSPQRLFEAAEATLVAAAQLSHVREPVHVPALMGTARQPRCLDEFARWEIEEATAFLVRLGLIEQRATA